MRDPYDGRDEKYDPIRDHQRSGHIVLSIGKRENEKEEGKA